MELIKRIYLNATNGHRYQEVTKGTIYFKDIYNEYYFFNTINIILLKFDQKVSFFFIFLLI